MKTKNKRLKTTMAPTLEHQIPTISIATLFLEALAVAIHAFAI